MHAERPERGPVVYFFRRAGKSYYGISGIRLKEDEVVFVYNKHFTENLPRHAVRQVDSSASGCHKVYFTNSMRYLGNQGSFILFDVVEGCYPVLTGSFLEHNIAYVMDGKNNVLWKNPRVPQPSVNKR